MGENDETGEDDTAVDNEVEECVWVPGEHKSVSGCQRTFVSLTLARTGVTLRLCVYQEERPRMLGKAGPG